ncbi:pyocin activator PrtN family protein [Roseateles sp.]|uniref:pyocin activator PrtN family protein n=1 Tax=Roseateles sp. TaxID=1971397 RepID=UPI003264F647
MNTAYILMVQYNAQAIIPLARVVEDYFPHLTLNQFIRRSAVGDITIPVIRIDPRSQKTAKGVHVADLVRYIERRREAAQKEVKQLSGTPPE